MLFIFKSSGQYLGFISNNNLFSRDGLYLGWVENNNVWGSDGQYRGQLVTINGKTYILKNIYIIPPIPKPPRAIPSIPTLPPPQANISPIILDIGLKDAF